MSKRWHILREGDSLTLARHLPPRFDVAAHAMLGQGNPLRLAHQIRQDLWRTLQNLRGFSPVVALRPTPAGWDVTVGGRAPHPVAKRHIQALHMLIQDPGCHARWVRNATKGG